MSWELLIYLIAFILQAVLLGIVMFQVRHAYCQTSAHRVSMHRRRLPHPCQQTPYWSSHSRRALQLISLSDLENDFINPHDASAQINAWVVRCKSRRAVHRDPHNNIARLLAFCSTDGWTCVMRSCLSTASRRLWS